MLEVVLTLDGVTAGYSARNHAAGDLFLVLTFDAATRGPLLGGGSVRARRRGIHYRAEGKLEVVLSLDAYTRFTDVIGREDEELLLII